MKQIVVIGHGRIGKPICEALIKHGSSVVAIKKCAIAESLQPTDYEVVTSHNAIDWQSIDAVILALSSSDPNYYANREEAISELRWLGELDPRIDLLSVAGEFSIAELKQYFGVQSVAKFMCSSAVASEESIRIIDSESSDSAVEALNLYLPSTNCHYKTGADFNRATNSLVLAATHCATLAKAAEIASKIDGFETDIRIAHLSLHEASLMIEYNESASLAYQSALSPKGLTNAISTRVFEESYKALGSGLLK